MKTKEVLIGDQTFKIGSLNCEQVEEITDQDLTNADGKTLRARSWKTIVDSINNAGGEPVDAKTLKRQLDLEGYSKLHDEVLMLSGLKRGEADSAAQTADQNQKEQQPEEKVVSISTS